MKTFNHIIYVSPLKNIQQPERSYLHSKYFSPNNHFWFVLRLLLVQTEPFHFPPAQWRENSVINRGVVSLLSVSGDLQINTVPITERHFFTYRSNSSLNLKYSTLFKHFFINLNYPEGKGSPLVLTSTMSDFKYLPSISSGISIWPR